MSDGSNLVIKRIGTYDLSGTRLGKGNFAFVELAINRVTKSKVAIKVIDTRKIKDEYVKRNVLREALILKKVLHPNVLKLYETLKQRGVYCLVTEYVPGGELLSLIRSQNESRLTEAQARPIVRQIASALHHLHERGIIHRDLKMENVLLDETKKNITLIDFGLSNICKNGELLKTQCGSPEYAAPELFKKDCRYSVEVDLWSLGVIAFGMVVGKLPFRTLHSGIRGRNDLVDQMSHGLNAIHSKYMSGLSPECRDFLRKLLEPNPYIRLPLQEVMAHPWVTMKGMWPLTPYESPNIDQEIVDKVLDKVSELIKMPKSKLEVHMARNRYDTVSGIYHLSLDEYLEREIQGEKAINKDRKDRHIVWNPSDDKDSHRKSISHRSHDGVIKVCIRQGLSPEEETTTNKTRNKNEETENKERMFLTPVSNKKFAIPGGVDSLQIRGMRLRSAKTRDTRQTRPYTTESSTKRNYRASSVPSRVRPHSVYMRSNRERFSEQEANTVQGRQMTMSPRTDAIKAEGCERNDQDTVASVLEEAENEESNEKSSQDNVTEESQDQENKTSPEKPLHSGVASVTIVKTIRSTELQRRPSKSPRHLRSGRQNKPVFVKATNATSSAPHSQVMDDKTGDNTKYRKMFTQSAKTETKRQLVNSVKKLGLSEKDLLRNSEGKVSDSMFNIYQRYLANCKPHHRRLSIMQAHEVIQREHTFQAKYGRKHESDTEQKHTEEQTDRDVTSQGDGPMKSAIGVHREKQPHHSIKTSNLSASTLQEDQKELLMHAAQCSWFKNDILESGLLNKDKECNATGNKTQEPSIGATGVSQEKDEKQRCTQESSLRRQKQKELIDEVEREQTRIERELQDTERVKLIEQYLDDVYTRYGCTTKTLQLEGTDRTTRVKATPKHKGNIYSWLPKKQAHGNFMSGVASKPASILHPFKESTHNFSLSCIDKKIDFKDKQGKSDNTKLRFFNDWSKTAFINYVNSEGEFLMDEADQDFSSQFKDPSYWMKHHLNGVVMKSNSK